MTGPHQDTGPALAVILPAGIPEGLSELGTAHGATAEYAWLQSSKCTSSWACVAVPDAHARRPAVRLTEDVENCIFKVECTLVNHGIPAVARHR
jgi:hypothetical protein